MMKPMYRLKSVHRLAFQRIQERESISMTCNHNMRSIQHASLSNPIQMSLTKEICILRNSPRTKFQRMQEEKSFDSKEREKREKSKEREKFSVSKDEQH
jgi:hypothetical protein